MMNAIVVWQVPVDQRLLRPLTIMSIANKAALECTDPPVYSSPEVLDLFDRVLLQD